MADKKGTAKTALGWTAGNGAGVREGSPRQDLFPIEYVKDFNATQAAIRCGYSARSARQTGSDLLAKPAIKAEIERLQEEARKRNELTVEEIDRRLCYLVRFSLKDYFHADGTQKTIEELTPEQAACVKEYSVVGTKESPRVVPTKFIDPLQSLRTAIQRFGMQKDPGAETEAYTFENWLRRIRAADERSKE